MLQRKQTIWLLLAAICAGLSMKFAFYSGNKISTPGQAATFQSLTATSNMLIDIITVVLLVGSLIVIFLYKDRRLQMRLALVLMVLSFGNIGLYYGETKDFVAGSFTLAAALVISIPIWLILAMRGIRRDSKLVK